MGVVDVIGLIIICVIIAAAAYYLKIYKPQQDAKAVALFGEEVAEEQAALILDDTEAVYKPYPTETISPPATIESTGLIVVPPPVYETKNTKFTTAQGLAIAIAPLVIFKILQLKLVKSGILLVKQILLKQASMILKALGKKLGKEVLMRAGIAAGKKAAAMAAQRIAARAAAVGAAKMATATAAAATTAAATGPAAPLVFAAEMAFIALTIGLDLGDAAGYLKMTTNNAYVDMKKEFDKSLNEALLTPLEGKTGLSANEIPVVVGPLTKFAKLVEEDQAKIINIGFEKLFVNNDPVFDKMNIAVTRDIENGTITQSQFENDTTLQDQYVTNNVNMEQALQKIFDEFCITNGGKMVSVNGINVCSYKDKETCEKSYKWPIEQLDEDEAPKDEYAEYRSNVGNGLCLLTNSALRSICELNKLDYNMDDGLCRVTEKYCKTKGADWKNNDCHINKGQEIAELFFGSTITRTLKQVFDPKQYEPCLAGEKDDGYFCRKVGCPDGEEQYANGGLCYPKCKDGYWASTANICAPKTAGVPAATARNFCPPGSYRTTLGMCMENCPDGYNNRGTPGICKANSCPAGYKTSTPGFCMEICKEGHRNVGGVCYQDCDKAYGPGYTDTGVGCLRPLIVHRKKTEERHKGKGCCCTIWGCCNKCPAGYNETPCTCIKPRCDDGYRDVGGVCYPDCDKVYGDGFIDDGAFCRRKSWARDKISYVPKSIPLPSMVPKSKPAECPAGKQDKDALCYNNCQPGYTMRTAAVCSFDGKEYGRGAGTVAVKIRAKKRVIPFSTKDN